MAEFDISCPSCGENVTVDSDWAGAEADCPYCANPFIVPELEAEPPAENPAPAAADTPGLPPDFDPSVFQYKPPQMPIKKSLIGAGIVLGAYFFYFLFRWDYACGFGLVLAVTGVTVNYSVLGTLKDKKGLSKASTLNTMICSWCALLLSLAVLILAVYRVNYANEHTPKEEKSFMKFVYAGLGLEYVEPKQKLNGPSPQKDKTPPAVLSGAVANKEKTEAALNE